MNVETIVFCSQWNLSSVRSSLVINRNVPLYSILGLQKPTCLFCANIILGCEKQMGIFFTISATTMNKLYEQFQ